MKRVPIKFQLFIGVFIAIMIVFIIIFVIGYGKMNRKTSHGDSILGSENLENGSVDEETGTYYQVSNSGARIYAYHSVSNDIIEMSKKYIKENGYDDEHILFVFRNSANTYLPKEIADQVLDVYHPNIEGENSSKNCPYYVEEMYVDSPESNYIGVGYFVITQEDGIKESIQLKTPEELSRIKKEPDIGLEATRRARQILKTNDDVDVIDSKRFFLDKGNENISLCYRVLFSDGKKMFINGITGEEMEN